MICFVSFVPTSFAQNISFKKQYTLSEYEQEVVNLVNNEREKHKLQPLVIDSKVSKLARQKSEDMRDNNYYDHTSPTYGKPCDHMRKEKVKFGYCGENIAAGQKTPQDVMGAWMNSEGHRENILNPNYTHIGVGYAEGGHYETYWTQQFYG